MALTQRMHPAPQHSEEPSTPGPVLLALSFLASSPILNRRPPPGHLALLEAAPQQVFPFASFFLLCVHVIVVLYYASWLGRVWQVARSQYAHTLKCLASHPGRVTFICNDLLGSLLPFPSSCEARHYNYPLRPSGTRGATNPLR